MPRREILDRIEKYVDPFRISSGKGFRLKDFDPGDTSGLKMGKDEAAELLARGSEWLAEEQAMLYAQDRWSLLLVFQAMDAAGKDGTIMHVMSGVNPQGCRVYSFKHPSLEELQHDFLWRSTRNLPERGQIGIFNRSYYEEVLITRVHPEILRSEGLPDSGRDESEIWPDRYRSIVEFEKHMVRNGTRILKFFLHLSKEEQRKRFLARIDQPEKNWKFSTADVEERKFWDDYMHAYSACLSATSSHEAPWYIIPADDKENARLIASHIICEEMDSLEMKFPHSDEKRKQELLNLRKLLER